MHRCPACGATNPDTAQWCGQCLTRFDEPEAPAVAPAPAPAGASPGETASSTTTSGNFRRRGDEIEWACPSCGEFNSLDLVQCSVCGTGFAEQFNTAEPEPPRNWNQILALSAISPGAGHLAIGRFASGIARLVLFYVWAIGVVLLLANGGSSAGLAVAPLLLGMVVLWAATLVDIHRLQVGEEELLAGRRLLWLVMGVLLLLGVGLVTALMSAAA